MTCASKRITQPTSIKPLSSYPEKYSGKKPYPTSGKETPQCCTNAIQLPIMSPTKWYLKVISKQSLKKRYISAYAPVSRIPLSFPLTACMPSNMTQWIPLSAICTTDCQLLRRQQKTAGICFSPNAPLPSTNRSFPASLPPPMISPVLPLKHKRPKIIFC